MLRTFNCGIGMIAVVGAGRADAVPRCSARGRRPPRASGGACRPTARSRRLCRHARPRGEDAAQTRRRPDFRPRLQHDGADRGGEGHDLSRRNRAGDFEPAGGWRLARAAAEVIATEVVDHTRFPKDREGFERALQSTLESHRIEIVCLAGFMRVLTTWFVARWSGRLLNIHPALLPAFKGLDTHRRALEAGASEHGATVHFVVPEMDSGPIITQGAVPVRRVTPRRCFRSACLRSSIASIRSHCGWWRPGKPEWWMIVV